MYEFRVGIVIRLYEGRQWNWISILGADKDLYLFHIVETKCYGPCSTLVIKCEILFYFILFLGTLNIFRNFRFFYPYPRGDPANLLNRQVWASEKRGTTLLGFSEM